jgi:hypothetical protein
MSPADETQPLVPYIRQSNTATGSDSMEVQWDAIVAWAAANRQTLYVDTIEEAQALGLMEPPSTSGNKGWRDRGLGKAIALVQDGHGSGVIGFDQSRITREDLLGQAEVWDALAKSGGILVDATGGGVVNRMTYVVKGEMNRQQWEQARDRSVISRTRAIKDGKYVGPTPAGYDRGPDQRLVPNGDGATITAAFELRAGGAPWSAVAKLLSDAGVKTSRGSTAWSLKGAEKALRNEAYKGVARSGDIRNEEAHERLVSDAVWNAVQARRELRGSYAKSTKPKALLSGLVTCASCGHKLTPDWTTRGGKRFETYRCRNTGACSQPVSIGRDLIDRFAVKFLLDETGNPTHVVKSKPVDLAPLEAALTSAETELQAYLGSVSAADIGPDLFKAGLLQRKAVKDDALALLEDAREKAPTGIGGIAYTLIERLQEIADNDPNQVNAILKALLGRVVVSAANGTQGAEGRVDIALIDPLPDLT